jgi:F-type H+-transporting ATPase subunit gamma
MANLKEIRNSYFRFIYDANYICDENGFCSKAKESTRCDYSHAYAEKLTELLQNLSDSEGDVEESIQHNGSKKSISSFKQRFCGAFNSNVIKASKSRSVFYAGKQVDVLQ